MWLDQFKPMWRFVEVGPCGLNCHKPKPNSTRNIIPSAADFDIYILELRLSCSHVCERIPKT